MIFDGWFWAAPGVWEKAGTYGTAVFTEADGELVYTLDNASAAVQSLGASDVETEEFTVRYTDGALAGTGTASFTVEGVNDAPTVTIGTASATLVEDGTASATASVSADDVEGDAASVDAAAMTSDGWSETAAGVWEKAGTYGTAMFTEADGEIVYTLDNGSAAVQGLGASDVEIEDFAVHYTDGTDTGTGTATFTIEGTNDAPSVTVGASSATLVEDGTASASASVAPDDVDGDTTTVDALAMAADGWTETAPGVWEKTGTYGTAVLTEADGEIVYTLDNGSAAVQALGASDDETEDFTVHYTDGTDTGTGTATFVIEGADEVRTGTDADDILLGTPYMDWLYGLGGNDLLIGQAAADLLDGGAGDDTLIGGDGDDLLRGGPGFDTLNGGAGDDRLFGGSGDDLLIGGIGDDTYVISVSGATVVELHDQGIDVVRSQVDFVLPEHVEILLLTGSAKNGSGNDDANLLFGNAVANILSGGGGDDVILGRGGRDRISGGDGSDLLFGGTGRDVLVGGAGEDILAGGDGNDRINGGADADIINGGSHDDRLSGEDGDDEIYGARGDDEIFGGEGNDFLDGGRGRDLLDGGEGSDFLWGGSGSDRLIGREGDDFLDGGFGSDEMIGGAGDDVYVVDDVGDVVREYAAGGVDTVLSLIDHVLAERVENLVLVGDALHGTGNAQANVIEGNDLENFLSGLGGADVLLGFEGDDRLEGGSGKDRLDGGAGADILVGGVGSDTFVFGDLDGSVDTVLDFRVGEDAIELAACAFLDLASGVLSADAFVASVGGAARDGDSRILYDLGTGALLYDADGLGGAAAVQFATISAGLVTLSASDFLVA